MSERHPELEPDPYDDGRPMPGARRRRVVRIAVLVALGAMVLPLVLSGFSVAKRAADRVCAVYVAAFDTDAAGFRTSFELFAPGGPGWECVAISSSGARTIVARLEPLPAMPRLPAQDDPRPERHA
ncbi:hypothetical protein [Agromyces sp. Marseille-P2726]|uniref:hypothetical protein n=1 Tax=Agromyces sp. Marseille-P2726 TaxID=2709132 RepID=UPI00156EED30|nr:hypothetical protein [Agromyces sp. Marseille-P2726]